MRECAEETGYTVTVERMVGIYEDILTDLQQRVDFEPYAHRIMNVFLCRLTDISPGAPTELDKGALGAEWIPLANMTGIPLYPLAFARNLTEMLNTTHPIFLGTDFV